MILVSTVLIKNFDNLLYWKYALVYIKSLIVVYTWVEWNGIIRWTKGILNPKHVLT